MGYYTRITGEITITPPIAWGDLTGSPFLPTAAHGHDYRDVMFDLAEETVETSEGTLIRRQAVAIVPVQEDAYKAYDLVDHIAEVVRTFPDRSYGGRLEGEGEEAGDLWRVYVRNGSVVKDVPQIMWPDGEIVEGRT